MFGNSSYAPWRSKIRALYNKMIEKKHAKALVIGAMKIVIIVTVYMKVGC